jgi:hypothetical protein
MGNDLEVMLKVRQQGIETFDRATTALKGLFAAYIGIAGARQFINFSIDAAKAADDEEKSNRKLINALKEKNLYTEQSFAFYKSFAEEQMMIVGKSHEEIESVQTLLLQYGIYGPLVNKTTKAIMDLAAAKGMDLNVATAIVLRGLESENGSLEKLGLSANGAAGSVERLSSIYEVLTKTFRGSAEAGASELDKIQLKWNELKEDFGKKVLPIVIKVGNTTVGFWDTLEQALKSTKEALTEGGQIKPSNKGFEVQLRYSEQMLKDAQERLKKSQGLKSDASVFEKLYIGTPESAQRAINSWSSKVEEWKKKIFDSNKSETSISPALASGITPQGVSDADLKKMQKITDAKLKESERQRKERWKEEEEFGKKSDKAFMDSENEKIRIASDNLQAWDKIYMHRRKLEEELIKSQREGAMAIGAAMAVGIGQGDKGFKESAKAVLITVIDLMEKKAQAMLIIQSLWDWSGLAKLAAVTFAFEALKKGISGFAAGTSFAPGGWAMVGERGPELINVPRGSQIYNNQQTRNMTTNNKPTVNLYITGGAGSLESQLERGVRSKEIDLPRLLETAGIYLGR